MSESTFLLVPTEVPEIEGLEKLDRAGRLAALNHSRSEIGAEVSRRLAGFAVTYLEGAGSWVVRSSRPTGTVELAQLLAGLPVKIADDSEFTAL